MIWLIVVIFAAVAGWVGFGVLLGLLGEMQVVVFVVAGYPTSPVGSECSVPSPVPSPAVLSKDYGTGWGLGADRMTRSRRMIGRSIEQT